MRIRAEEDQRSIVRTVKDIELESGMSNGREDISNQL